MARFSTRRRGVRDLWRGVRYEREEQMNMNFSPYSRWSFAARLPSPQLLGDCSRSTSAASQVRRLLPSGVRTSAADAYPREQKPPRLTHSWSSAGSIPGGSRAVTKHPGFERATPKAVSLSAASRLVLNVHVLRQHRGSPPGPPSLRRHTKVPRCPTRCRT